MKQIAWIVLGWLALLTTTTAASFDCEKAVTTIEHLICQDRQASDLDEELRQAYVKALERRNGKQTVIQEQKQWLKEIRNLCQDSMCISLDIMY